MINSPSLNSPEGNIATLLAGMTENIHHESLWPALKRLHDESYGPLLAAPTDYAIRAPTMQGGQTPHPGITNLLSDNPIRYSPNETIGLAPSDLRMLANTLYQNEGQVSSQALDAKIFQYQPGGCSGGYCGN